MLANSAGTCMCCGEQYPAGTDLSRIGTRFKIRSHMRTESFSAPVPLHGDQSRVNILYGLSR
jgi:hypothetical protein